MDIESVDEVLSTTRAVRRRLDLSRPVEREVILECLRLAVQAPTGGNAQDWRWLVVTDADKRAAIAELYNSAGAEYLANAAKAAVIWLGRIAGMSDPMITTGPGPARSRIRCMRMPRLPPSRQTARPASPWPMSSRT